MVTEEVENMTEISIMAEDVGEKMVLPIHIFPEQEAEEHFLLVVVVGVVVHLATRLVVNVQGKTRTFQSGPWMMTLIVESTLEEHLIHQVSYLLKI